jgi:hypothetical protein
MQRPRFTGEGLGKAPITPAKELKRMAGARRNSTLPSLFMRGSQALLMDPIQNYLGDFFIALVQIHRVAVTRQSNIRQVDMVRS